MKKIIVLIWFLFLLLPVDFLFAGEEEKEVETTKISEEDKEIIKVLEVLKLMDMMKDYDLVQDMEILIEENTDENNK